eukprot:2249530-Rhodomonas_salina.1
MQSVLFLVQRAEKRLMQAEFKLKQRMEKFGKSVEAVRGTIGFAPGTGCHKWILRWEHEPKLAGKGSFFSIALRACYEISGNDLGYAATRCSAMLLPGDAVGVGTSQSEVGSIMLRARYAMSSTELVYATIRLRAYYAMSGIDLASNSAIGLRARYAMSGTEIAYGQVADPCEPPSLGGAYDE